ncbi:MAG TPA: universal stress protein [Gemmatimonadales bacterium]|nr:universal stress protein [Gemmatimonadales bacterium]
MFRTILVPLDGSRLAEEALPTAVATARRTGATLQLAMVHHPVMPSADSAAMTSAFTELDRLAHEGEKRYLASVAERIRGESDLVVHTAILEGAVGERLAAHATSLPADLVVMTTHGRGAVSRMWLGSVADELLRHLTMPLLLLRHRAPEPAYGRSGFRRILIPLDGSARSEAILEPALAICPPLGAHYSLLRVVIPPPALAEPAVAARGGEPSDVIEGERRQAAAYLDRIADRLEARGCHVSTQVIVGDAPARVIIEQGNPAVTDCIALATRGAAGMTRLLLGSVTDKVVRGAEVPVLALHPPQSEDESTHASVAAQSAEGLSREGVAIGG